jgi:hypothetical protein
MDAPETPEASLPQIEPLVRTRTPTTQPPAFGLAQLFLYVGCCAIYLTLVRQLMKTEPGVLGYALIAAYGLGTAAAWSGLVLFLIRWAARSRWPIEPGFYLAAVLGLRLALDALLACFAQRMIQSQELVLNVVVGIALVWPLMDRWPTRWEVVSGGLLTLHLLSLSTLWFPPLYSAWTYASPVAIVALMLIGAWLDKRSGARFSWLHWLGIGLWIWYALMLLIRRLL